MRGSTADVRASSQLDAFSATVVTCPACAGAGHPAGSESPGAVENMLPYHVVQGGKQPSRTVSPH